MPLIEHNCFFRLSFKKIFLSLFFKRTFKSAHMIIIIVVTVKKRRREIRDHKYFSEGCQNMWKFLLHNHYQIFDLMTYKFASFGDWNISLSHIINVRICFMLRGVFSCVLMCKRDFFLFLLFFQFPPSMHKMWNQ